jgi:23S rRNA pseudouridine2605 synthase
MAEEAKSGERLQVVLARFGLASRRGVVELIEAGKVEVNGKVVLEKGHRVDSAKDEIRVDGAQLPLQTGQKKAYYLLNKPKGVMTTMQDPNAESTVADFFHDVPERLFPVGRLDRDTTGLILMTNDGELAFRLTHPKFGVKKRYLTRVRGVVSDADIKKLEAGVELEEGKTAPCEIRVENSTAKETVLRVVLHEGKKRQIRRIFETVGHRVLDLMRVSYGPLSLGEMRPGEKRRLADREVKALYEATGLVKEKRGGR